jgi:peptide/nickel transport system substrate-binding protein
VKKRGATIGQMQDILYKANDDIMLYNDNTLYAVRTDKVSNFALGKPDANGATRCRTTSSRGSTPRL